MKTLCAQRRGRPAHPEDDLQGELIALHRRLVLPEDCIVIAVPNGEKRDPIVAARLSGISAQRRAAMNDGDALLPYGQGVLPGVTDLILILPLSRVVWVEVKIPQITYPPAHIPCAGKRQVLHEAGVLSKAQKRFRGGLLVLAHEHRVVRTPDEYLDVLEAEGVPFQHPRPWGPGYAPRPR